MSKLEFKYTHVWNDLPPEEKHRLWPQAIESQILHIEQTKSVMIRHHKRALSELNAQIKNLKQGIKEWERKNNK